MSKLANSNNGRNFTSELTALADLSEVHELGDHVLVVLAVLVVVAADELLERGPQLQLVSLLQAQGDHGRTHQAGRARRAGALRIIK